MGKKSMREYAANWKSPEQRKAEKKVADPPRSEVKAAGKVAKKAPPDTSKPKGKNSPDSKGPGVNSWTKSATKKPKGC